MCVYACVYVYYIYIYTTYARIYIYIYVYVCIRLHIHLYIHTHKLHFGPAIEYRFKRNATESHEETNTEILELL